MRGYDLRSIGILVAQSPRPTPWRHVSKLRGLISHLYEHTEDWEALSEYFDTKKSVSKVQDEGSWKGWDEEYHDDQVARPHL
jgi:hypothetical protein